MWIDRRLQKTEVAPALLLMLLVCLGCGTGASPPQDDGQENNAVVLRIEGREFTTRDFADYVEYGVGEKAGNLSPDALSRLFDRFFDEKVLLAAARLKNVVLTDEEKSEYLAEVSIASVSNNASGETGAGSSGRLFERQLVEKYARQTLQGTEATQAEIREYYDEHKRDFLLAERIQVSQILYETEEKAVDALRRLENAPPAEYRRTAREESLGPEAVRGGLMGVYKPGDLPSDMEKVVFSLREGKLSQVVESSYGFHIFRVDKKFPPHLQTVGEATPAIRLKVLEEKYKETMAAHIDELKNDLSWDVYLENLPFPYQRLSG
jgi:hypothetical protein